MLAITAVIFLAATNASPTDSCTLPNEEVIQQFLTMKLEERTVPLLVPRRFAEDAAGRVQGASHGAQLFRVDTTTFEPVSRKETGIRMAEGRLGYVRFLLSDFIDLGGVLRRDCCVSWP